MRITTLIENSHHPNKPELNAEHGVSFYIENNGYVFMSDVSQSGKFAENASKLGVDLTRVEALTISHYHYDHGGGLACFFKENRQAKVYLREASNVNCFAEDEDRSMRYIGLDMHLLKEHGDRIEYIGENREILPGFHLLSDIPEVYPKPSGNQRLMVQEGGQKKPDTFDHELVSVVECINGLVVLTGCGHNGVLNMVEAVHKALPYKPILAVVGGFHMIQEKERSVREVANVLLSMEIPEVYTGHCTGDDAVAVLEDVLGERLHRLYSGLVMTF